ncbi:hypothetical protein [Cohnella soli]|uniref:Uncharacterized protein n=1 Tax=Cohnella soli TaxID=425005 RepID=A0ABW0HSB0_9BACL
MSYSKELALVESALKRFEGKSLDELKKLEMYFSADEGSRPVLNSFVGIIVGIIIGSFTFNINKVSTKFSDTTSIVFAGILNMVLVAVIGFMHVRLIKNARKANLNLIAIKKLIERKTHESE